MDKLQCVDVENDTFLKHGWMYYVCVWCDNF